MEENGKLNNVYIGALKLRNIKCFKDEHIIDFTDKEGKLHQWTVILGNNNTGKTTILRAIADLEPIQLSTESRYHVYKGSPFNILRGFSQNLHHKEAGRDQYVGAELFIEDFPQLDLDLTISQKSFYSYSGSFHDMEENFNWGYMPNFMWASAKLNEIKNFIIYGYGINRRTNEVSSLILDTDTTKKSNSSTLFYNDVDLINAEEWLIQLDYAKKNERKEAATQLEKVKQLLTSGILPDVQDFRFISDENFNNYVEFKTDYGWVRLHELGYGYRSSIAWIVDLAKKMFERYPDSENPLAEAAVVLVDELDLHLHPEWQRKIISFLTKHFPNTQFIVTAHSPLVVQSAERVNIVLLNKEEDHVTITQPNIPTFKGWTVEEILSELMNLGERTQSDAYLQLMDDFENALDKEDFEGAQKAYDQLSAILHPDSPQRKLLRMQMSAIVHD